MFKKDPIEAMIESDGYVDNHRLWRRWVLAQICRNMPKEDKHKECREEYFTTAFLKRAFPYQWRTAEQEIRTIVKLPKKEQKKRTRFFDFDVAIDLIEVYRNMLLTVMQTEESAISDNIGKIADILPRGYRLSWQNAPNKNKQMYYHGPVTPNLENCIKGMDIAMDMAINAKRTKSYDLLVRMFTVCSPYMYPTKTECKSDVWMTAFKASGAYYSMDNLIKFHGYTMPDLESGLPCGSQKKSLHMLEQMANDHAHHKTPMSAHLLFQTMLQLMDSNQQHGTSGK